MDDEVGYRSAIHDGEFTFNASELVRYGEQSDEGDHMTAKSLQHFKELKQLEYLWIPGPFLQPDSMGTIEGFNRLRELHALHTAVDPLVLKRVAKLTSIKKLSIGVGVFDDEIKEILQSMQHLELLQIYVVDVPYDEDYELDRDPIENELNRILPNTKIHLITHEELSWITS